jgi:hypothetical protein
VAVEGDVKIDVEVVVVPGWADSTARTWVVSAVVLVLVSTAGCPARSTVPVMLVDGGWASTSEADLLSACPAFWDVAVEL